MDVRAALLAVVRGGDPGGMRKGGGTLPRPSRVLKRRKEQATSPDSSGDLAAILYGFAIYTKFSAGKYLFENGAELLARLKESHARVHRQGLLHGAGTGSLQANAQQRAMTMNRNRRTIGRQMRMRRIRAAQRMMPKAKRRQCREADGWDEAPRRRRSGRGRRADSLWNRLRVQSKAKRRRRRRRQGS